MLSRKVGLSKHLCNKLGSPRHRLAKLPFHLTKESRHGQSSTSKIKTAILETARKVEDKIKEENPLDYEDNDFEDIDAPEAEESFTTQQVQELMNIVCEETKFAEIGLKVGSFSVRARRMAAGSSTQEPSALSVAGSSSVAPPLPTSANELPFQSTASIDESQILHPSPKATSSVSSMDEDDYDENLLYIGAPKVGILRRGRYVKGRRIGKGPIAEEGSRVKKGQPLAFIEQLGTFVPVEAPQAGEIATFNIEDGKAVEYKDVIVEIAPFFGGHIIGDRKYA